MSFVETLQTRLEYSSADLTMNIYTHVIEQNDREAAEITEKLVSQSVDRFNQLGNRQKITKPPLLRGKSFI